MGAKFSVKKVPGKNGPIIARVFSGPEWRLSAPLTRPSASITLGPTHKDLRITLNIEVNE